MRSHLTIKAVSRSVSVALAVLYVVIMLAGLLLYGVLTTGSFWAAFLGIGWSTIAGFEIGLLVIVIAGYATGRVFELAYSFLGHRATGRSNQPRVLSIQTCQARLFVAGLVLPALTLITLHALAWAANLASAPGAIGAKMLDPKVRAQPVNTGSTINTMFREAEPSFTADGRTMYFNCNNTDICVSHLVGTWEQGNWTTPERLGAPINTEYEEVEPVINAAGDKLYFTSTRPNGPLKKIPVLSPFTSALRVVNTLVTSKPGTPPILGGLGLSDVWVSTFFNGAWSEPRNLNDVAGEPSINTEYDDHCLFFSANGNEAFWTSTKPGGFGKDDIWTSRRAGGKWTEPENLGSNVNGPGSEHTSIPTPDGHNLYVTTMRPDGFGGEDIYVTTRDSDGKWGPLVNLGPEVNGPGDDRCPAWTPDLEVFLFDSVREGGFGAKDIWWVYFKDIKGYPLAVSASKSAPDIAP